MSDAGRYRKLFIRLWSHPRFSELTDAEKIVAMYLLTGPQTNRIGLYRLSPATAAEDLHTSLEAYRKRLDRVCLAFGWLFDATARVFYIPSWWRWNPPSNHKHMEGILKDLHDLPPCGLVEAFARNIESIPEEYRQAYTKGLREGLHGRSRYQDLDLDLEEKQEKAATRKPCSDEEHDGAGRPNGATTGRQAKLEILARKALTFTDANGELETLLDTFYVVARAEQVHDVAKHEALRAVNLALAEHRSRS